MGTKRDDVKDDQDGRENYDGLSPEEIASLEEGDDDADVIDELLGEGEGDDPADDGGDGDGDLASEDEGEEAGADAGDQSAEDQEGGDEGEEEGEEEGDEARHPPIAAQQEDALQSFNTRAAELEEKFNNGDIELPEYMREVSMIAEERALYRMQVQMAAEADNRAWDAANQAFFESNPDYAEATSPKRFAVLQAMVDATAADPSFKPRSYLDLLNEAKRRFDDAVGVQKGGGEGEQQPAAGAKQKPRLVADRGNLPRTIKDAPAEGAAPSGGGEFSALDGLSGMELEAAVARMTPEQQARWAEAG